MSRDKLFKVLSFVFLLWSAILLPSLVSFQVAVGIIAVIGGLEGIILKRLKKLSTWVFVTYSALILALVLTKVYDLALFASAITGFLISIFLVGSYLTITLFKKNKKLKKVIFVIPYVYLFAAGLINIILFQYGFHKLSNSRYDSDVIMSIESKDVPFSEFLLYATNVYQNYNAAYGTDIWTEIITDKEGNEFTFEEQTKQVIIEQIRLTKLLYQKKEEYEVSLSEDEIKLLKADAGEYRQGLESSGITEEIISEEDVEKFYVENAISQKVYNKIIKDVDVSNMSDEEAEDARVEVFQKVYSTITREINPSWNYEKNVNMKALVEISFSNLANNIPSTESNTATDKKKVIDFKK